MRHSREIYRRIDEFFGPRGFFAGEYGNYEDRPEQVIMAREVLASFVNARFLIVEAGTGTGKSFAYLVPALLSGQKVIISSGTKNLQEQIFYKDLPMLARRFKFKATLMKGRSNYLCWHRFREFLRNPMFPFKDEIEPFKQIEDWSARTETGDRAEISELPDDYATWREISATSEQCLGSKCPHFKDCFITRMRREAQAADIIVVNHHLFFADLSVRGGGFGEVIPRYRAVIFDEAHQLEDIATEYFGFQVSDFRIEDLARDIRRSLPALIKDASERKGFENALEVLRDHGRMFFRSVGSMPEEPWNREQRFDDGKRFLLKDKYMTENISRQGLELCASLKDMGDRFSAIAEKEAEASNLKSRCGQISGELEFILQRQDPDYVYWCESRPRSFVLRASPLEVGSSLEKSLYSNVDTMVFTSATLATRRGRDWSFEYIKNSLGLEPVSSRVDELKLGSSFKFMDQAVFYIPRSLPEPNSREFIEAAADEMEKLVNITRGRAFLLFTSFRNMQSAYDILSERLDYELLIQGERPRTALVEQFRKADRAVLFATSSFWQGVDVIGPALSLVVVDKLPFAPPTDPLLSARIDRINKTTGDAFRSYQVPTAVIALKQGLGRLIRSKTDFGILSVLDVRLRKKSYGRIFLDSLPKMRVTEDIGEVEKFFKHKERSNIS